MKFRDTEIFSENWHWLAPRVFQLRSHINVRRRSYRGKTSYVIEDAVSNRFIRLSPPLYEFVAHFDDKTSLGELWEKHLQAYPNTAPSQQEVVNCISQLHSAGVIVSDHPLSSELLYEKYQTDRNNRLKKQWMQFLFLRIPLVNPDNFLKKTLPFGNFLFSKLMGYIWLIVVSAGLFVAFSNARGLIESGSGLFDPGNWLLLYLVWAVVKLLHELGHAYACRSRGGQVTAMGVMLLVFIPIPYVDATSAWRFRSKYDRVLVASAGMLVEFFCAAIAVFIWSQTSSESLINQLAYNLIFLASVSTILFNINPLLRFDGYYIFSDLMDTPNLQTRSTRHLKYILERYVFGLFNSPQPEGNRRESSYYVTYGLLSGLYRIFIFAVILLFVAEQFWGLGILFALTGAVIFIVLPISKFIRYLSTAPQLQTVRNRVKQVSFALLISLIILLAVVPFPRSIIAPVIVQPSSEDLIYAPVAGLIEQIVKSGERVDIGQPLIQLSNREFEFSLKQLQAQQTEYMGLRDWAMVAQPEIIAALSSSIVANSDRIEKNNADLQKLILDAETSGIWVATSEGGFTSGQLIEKGSSLGQIVNANTEGKVTIVIDQQQAAAVFSEQPNEAIIRFKGAAFQPIRIENLELLENQQQRLSNASLGWAGGGPIPVDSQDPEGTLALEPFYEITAHIPLLDKEAPQWLNRSGLAKISLQPEPLIWQATRKVRQLFQRRLRL